MLIDNIHDYLKALDKLSRFKDISDMATETDGHFIIASTDQKVLNNDDSEIQDIIETLELCSSYYLFFESGLPNKNSERLLAAQKYSVKKIGNLEYIVGNDKFNIRFNL